MSAVPKKKLCWQCEGSIDRHMDNCPFCGVYLHAQEEEEDTSSWNPPFNLKVLTKEKKEDVFQNETKPSVESQVKLDTALETSSVDHVKKEILPLALLLAGSCFFLFSIVLLLFSQEGTLTLKWNGDYWIYYMLVALPALFFGWRHLTDD